MNLNDVKSTCNPSNLRSILVRTTSCQVHPAICTRPWRASFRIAWVLCQLGSLHNVKKSTSAMSKPKRLIRFDSIDLSLSAKLTIILLSPKIKIHSYCLCKQKKNHPVAPSLLLAEITKIGTYQFFLFPSILLPHFFYTTSPY